jgi:hypothetical protein
MIKVLDIGGLDVKTAGLLFNPANEIHSNIFHLCPLLSDQPLWISTCRPCPIRFPHDGDLFTAVFSLKRECLMTVLFVCSFLSGALHLLFSAYCLLFPPRCFPSTVYCLLLSSPAYCLLPSAFLLGTIWKLL